MDNQAIHHDGLRALDRAGQVVPGQRRPERRQRPGVRQERQVPVLPRVDRRRAGQGLVRAVERRHARDVRRSISRCCRTTSVSPLARESDEEKPADRSKKDRSPRSRPPTGSRGQARRAHTGREAAGEEGRAVPDRLRGPRVSHPRSADSAGDLSNLQAGTAGQIYYLKTVDGETSLNRYDLTTRKNETLLPEANDYVVSADGKKLLYRNAQQPGRSCRPTKAIEPAEGRIAVDTIEVRIDPRAEWKQIFDEAWRINRDYFYAPNMHGVDWAKQREKYAAFLPARGHARRSQPRDPVDVERAVGRPSQRRRRRHADRAEDRARRPARRRLRGRQRPLPASRRSTAA